MRRAAGSEILPGGRSAVAGAGAARVRHLVRRHGADRLRVTLEDGPFAAEILGRDPEDEELRRWANEVRLVALKSWPKAPEGISPEGHLDKMVELWATELRRQVRLNCWDVAFIPIFAVALPAVVLSFAVPDWAAGSAGYCSPSL